MSHQLMATVFCCIVKTSLRWLKFRHVILGKRQLLNINYQQLVSICIIINVSLKQTLRTLNYEQRIFQQKYEIIPFTDYVFCRLVL